MIGEIAFARFMGEPWNVPVGYRAALQQRGDVGAWEVRCSYRSDAELILRPNDRRESRYALVIYSDGVARFPGWVLAGGVMASRHPDIYRRARPGDTRPPAWFVPQHRLTPWVTRSDENSCAPSPSA